MYIPASIVRFIERIRYLTNFRGVYHRDPMVMPVFQVNDAQSKPITRLFRETTSTTMVTVPTAAQRKRFYITGVQLSGANQGGAGTGVVEIDTTVNGTSVVLGALNLPDSGLPGVTTATVFNDFSNNPILVQAGAGIGSTITSSDGNCIVFAFEEAF